MLCDSPLFQAVRVVDVFILGPTMIAIGNKTRGPAGAFLAVAGIATIIFNGLTFLEIHNDRR